MNLNKELLCIGLFNIIFLSILLILVDFNDETYYSVIRHTSGFLMFNLVLIISLFLPFKERSLRTFFIRVIAFPMLLLICFLTSFELIGTVDIFNILITSSPGALNLSLFLPSALFWFFSTNPGRLG